MCIRDRRTNIPYVQVEMNSAALDEGPREHMLAALTRIVQRFAEELA